MSEVYGHRFVSSYGAAPSDTWARGLAGITGDQLAAGLMACAQSSDEWPPSLPKFRAICLAVPGLPSAEEAWAEALPIARRWKRPHECSHPAVYHALSQVVNYNFIEEEALHKRFIRNYEMVCADVFAGRELSPIAQPLPRPEDVRTNYSEEARKAAADAAMAKINAMMGRSQ